MVYAKLKNPFYLLPNGGVLLPDSIVKCRCMSAHHNDAVLCTVETNQIIESKDNQSVYLDKEISILVYTNNLVFSHVVEG